MVLQFEAREDSQGTWYKDHRHWENTAFAPRVSFITPPRVQIRLQDCCLNPDEAEEFANMLKAAAQQARAYGEQYAARE